MGSSHWLYVSNVYQILLKRLELVKLYLNLFLYTFDSHKQIYAFRWNVWVLIVKQSLIGTELEAKKFRNMRPTYA